MKQLQLPLAVERVPNALRNAVVQLLADHSGGPSPVLTVTKVKKERSQRGKCVTADVILFDGQPGTVRVWFREGDAWSGHQWLNLPGGNIELINGQWRRDA